MKLIPSLIEADDAHDDGLVEFIHLALQFGERRGVSSLLHATLKGTTHGLRHRVEVDVVSGDLLNAGRFSELASLSSNLVGAASSNAHLSIAEEGCVPGEILGDAVELLAHLRNVDVRVDCDVPEVTLDGLAKILPSTVLLAQRARHVAKRGERLVPDLLGQRLRKALGRLADLALELSADATTSLTASLAVLLLHVLAKNLLEILDLIADGVLEVAEARNNLNEDAASGVRSGSCNCHDFLLLGIDLPTPTVYHALFFEHPRDEVTVLLFAARDPLAGDLLLQRRLRAGVLLWRLRRRRRVDGDNRGADGEDGVVDVGELAVDGRPAPEAHLLLGVAPLPLLVVEDLARHDLRVLLVHGERRGSRRPAREAADEVEDGLPLPPAPQLAKLKPQWCEVGDDLAAEVVNKVGDMVGDVELGEVVAGPPPVEDQLTLPFGESHGADIVDDVLCLQNGEDGLEVHAARVGQGALLAVDDRDELTAILKPLDAMHSFCPSK